MTASEPVDSTWHRPGPQLWQELECQVGLHIFPNTLSEVWCLGRFRCIQILLVRGLKNGFAHDRVSGDCHRVGLGAEC